MIHKTLDATVCTDDTDHAQEALNEWRIDMGSQQTLLERAIRIESKLSRYITEQEERNRRLDKMLDEWDEFKREWDEEGADGENTGGDHGHAAQMPDSDAQRRVHGI